MLGSLIRKEATLLFLTFKQNILKQLCYYVDLKNEIWRNPLDLNGTVMEIENEWALAIRSAIRCSLGLSNILHSNNIEKQYPYLPKFLTNPLYLVNDSSLLLKNQDCPPIYELYHTYSLQEPLWSNPSSRSQQLSLKQITFALFQVRKIQLVVSWYIKNITDAKYSMYIYKIFIIYSLNCRSIK